MKVWVVIERRRSRSPLRINVAVFSTETAANNFVRDNEDNWWVYYDVEEWEVAGENPAVPLNE